MLSIRQQIARFALCFSNKRVLNPLTGKRHSLRSDYLKFQRSVAISFRPHRTVRASDKTIEYNYLANSKIVVPHDRSLPARYEKVA